MATSVGLKRKLLLPAAVGAYVVYFLLSRTNEPVLETLGLLPLAGMGLSFGLILAGVCLFVLRQHKSFTGAYVLMASGLGLLYVLMITPLSAPDETFHYMEVQAMAHRLLGRSAIDGHYFDFAGITLGQNDLPSLTAALRGLSGEALSGNLIPFAFTPHLDRMLVYLPQILGTALSVALGLNRFGLMLVSDLLTMGSYIALCAGAIRIIPRRWQVLLGLATLVPMALQQAASFSYDAMVNGLCFLWIAAWVRLMDDGARSVRVLFLLLGWVIVPVKPPYAVIYLLGAFVPQNHFGKTRRKWWMLGATFLLSMAAALVLHQLQPVDRLNPALEDATYTLGRVVFSPLETLRLFAMSINPYALFNLLETSVGSNLSALSLHLPLGGVWGMILVLVLLALLHEDSAQPPFTAVQRWGMAGAVAAAYLGVLLIMLLSWTPLGSAAIEGVQGRYFTPLLPLLLMALSTPDLVGKKDYTPLLTTLFMLLSIYLVNGIWVGTTGF